MRRLSLIAHWALRVVLALVLLRVILGAYMEMTGQGPHGRQLPVLTVNIFAEPLLTLAIAIAAQPVVFIPLVALGLWAIFKR